MVTPTPTATTAIIGGGASGVLTAINLLAQSADPDLRVTLHEASGIVGRGIAYGTNDPLHLLNVRARHMSAFPDSPSDLIDWARRTGRSEDAQAFLPRQDFAAYLQDRLAKVADHRLSIHAGRVDDIARVGDGYEVRSDVQRLDRIDGRACLRQPGAAHLGGGRRRPPGRALAPA